jgi:hypothetical protein
MSSDYEQDNSNWNNPMVQSARKAMKAEDIELMKKKGEAMFSIDFEKSGESGAVLDGVDPNKEVMDQLVAMLKSGIHPSYLTKEEKEFLTLNIGAKWYEEFGWLINDLNKINM